MDRKRLEARLNLARHFFQHSIRRLFSHEDAEGTGFDEFLSKYRKDNIFQIDSHEREQYPMFARCVQCNICQPYCVMFRAIGSQEFPGPMVVASTLSRALAELGTTSGVIYNCTQCRLCETTCPEDAPIAEIVGFMRKYIYKYSQELVPKPLREMCSLVQRRGSIFDTPASEVRHEKNTAEYVLFLGCYGRAGQQQRARAAVSMLDRMAVDFTTIDEVCCGAPLRTAGSEVGPDLAEANIEHIREKNTAKVITLCPHCLVEFHEGGGYAGKLEAIHIAELLPELPSSSRSREVVAYHDPCMLGRVCGVFDRPRQALTFAGVRLAEMDPIREMAFCCGNWGGLGLSARNTAEAIASRRLEDAQSVGADVLLTECPWCLDIFHSANPPGGKPRISSVVEYLVGPEE